MAVVDRSPGVRAPPYEQGFPYHVDFGAGDAVVVRPALRVSSGRVSLSWTLKVGSGASVARSLSLLPALDDGSWRLLDAALDADTGDWEDAPFAAMRFAQGAGGAPSSLFVLSRWPLAVEEG